METASILGKNVTVLAEQDGLIVLNKPAGIRSHPNKPGVDSNALIRLPYDKAAEAFIDRASGYILHLLNRLDAPTSGLILLSTDAKLAATIRAGFEEREIHKTYLAWVSGFVRLKQARWQDRLETKPSENGVRTRKSPSGQICVCVADTLKNVQKPTALTLLELKPETGRTHQLRVQTALRNMPIVGDATYGDFRLNKLISTQTKQNRLMLHAWKMHLSYVHNGKNRTLQIECPVPGDFL
jgi:23S rRNA-/tRNA-specific pseudouridylate synthase